MKKTIIIAIITLGVVTIAASLFIFIKHPVKVTLEGDDFSVIIYTKSGNKITEIKESIKTISLRRGDYTYSISGDGYDTKAVSFKVTGSTTLSISPQYLASYLPNLVERELPIIQDMFKQQYPDVKAISIIKLSITTSGIWAYGKLTAQGNTTDVYRFILKRNAGAWDIAIKPTIAIEKEKTKGIPEEIVYSLY